MESITEEKKNEQIDAGGIISHLNAVLNPAFDAKSVLNSIVQKIYELGCCEHVFISRYDCTEKVFKTVAWRSTINPGSVSLEQKFMGSMYVENKMCVIKDLSVFNHRLRSKVARLGFKSMVGVPLVKKEGVFGVLEAFSYELDSFSEDVIELISLYAKQAALMLENADWERECKYWAIENKFFYETQMIDQRSTGMLLFRLGETLDRLLDPDGIVVFGIEEQAEDFLQEVLAKGFSTQDIGLLKKVVDQKFLNRLLTLAEEETEQFVFKQLIKGAGAVDEKLIYIEPVIRRQVVYGIIVFFWKQPNADVDLRILEQFAKRMVGYVAHTLDRKHIYSSIQKIGFTDMLTDLGNRRLFDYMLNREFEKVKRDSSCLSTLLIDIDYFKNINDSYGHIIGDAILEQLGGLIKKYFRDADIPARYGGEEFAVILPDTTQQAAMRVAERFRQDVENKQFQASNQRIKITVSIGVATHSFGGGEVFSNTISFLHAADQALYQAKQMGRNRSVSCSCIENEGCENRDVIRL